MSAPYKPVHVNGFVISRAGDTWRMVNKHGQVVATNSNVAALEAAAAHMDANKKL